MNIRDFTYLINLAKTSHFGRAAAISFVSQPTLSIQIKKLEEDLGCQLIERRGKTTELTEAGKIAVQRAEQIIGAIQDLQNHMKNFQDPLAGEWKLGIFSTLAPYLLPHIITPLKKSMPKVTLQIFEEITSKCIEHLKQGDWDAILISETIEDVNITGAQLFREKFFLAIPTQHALNQLNTITSNDIPENEILLLENGHCLRDQAIAYCKKINKSFQQQFFASSLETLISMVALGEGITFIPELSLDAFKHYPISIRPISSPPYRDIYLYWRKSTSRHACITEFQRVVDEDLQSKF